MNPAQPHNFFSKKNLPASDIEAGKLLLIDGLVLIYRGLSRKVRFFTRLLQGHLVWLWYGKRCYSNDEATGAWTVTYFSICLILIIVRRILTL